MRRPCASALGPGPARSVTHRQLQKEEVGRWTLSTPVCLACNGLHTLASGTNPCQVLRHPCLRSPARTTPRSQRSRCNREPTPQSYHFPRHCTDEISMLFQLVSLLQNTLSRPGLRLREAQSPSRISLAQFHRLLRLAGG